MMLPREGHLLRIFVGENDRHQDRPLHEWIVRTAREQGLAGATVIRGSEGFDAAVREGLATVEKVDIRFYRSPDTE